MDRKSSRRRSEYLLTIILCSAVLMVLTSILLFYTENKHRVERIAALNEAARTKVTEYASPSPTALPLPSTSPSPSPSPTPSPSPSPELHLKETVLSVSSAEEDLYVVVRDENYSPIWNENFVLKFTYPDGETETWRTDTDGTCYLVRLPAGEYRVEMQPMEGYKTPAAQCCEVKERVERTVIENITEVVEVVEVTEISTEEVKTPNTEYVPPAEEPEVIITEEQEQQAEEAAPQVQKTAANGAPLYTYSFETGEHGLLLREDGTESDIHAVAAGELLYGVREYTDEYGTPMSEELPLLQADNTPIPGYRITAAPVYEGMASVTGWQTIDGESYYITSSGHRLTGLKEVDGRLCFFSPSGVKASTLGVDVSYFNGYIDWNAVKAHGIDFAILRIGGRGWGTAGTLYNDDRFYENLSGAKAAGLDVGVYFYSSAVTIEEAIEEASLTVERLQGIGLDYPVYIDMEYSGEYPGGRADTLSVEQHTAIVKAFCDTVQNAGYRAGVYSGQYYYTHELNMDELTVYSIWMASYTKNYQLPGYEYFYRIWQFTDVGHVNGIPGNVDLNVIF